MPHAQIRTLAHHPATSLVSRAVAALTAGLARRRDRALLARLDAHLLRDIGVDAEQAAKECAKPFWQP